MKIDQSTWNGAVRHLYEDAFVYVATGARHHEDWRSDVLAVVERGVTDPQGWLVLDDSADAPERDEWPSFPYRQFTTEELGERLFAIDRDSAEQLLLALTDDGCTLQNTRRFRESTDELRELARHILARYGTGATFHTNITGARNTGTLDFTSSGQA
ncbi:hypothetical protein [Streptomyces purpureus]|uniref:hypothetical protein n=1 Tax=Streptomyces purpureus TaxID=1951 RepID=UPI0003A0517B|nr:hypothetical protein [Streptomyces purpureus]